MVVMRIDGRVDILIVKTYLVEGDVPFLCSKWTLELWNFMIDSKRKILETNLNGKRK